MSRKPKFQPAEVLDEFRANNNMRKLAQLAKRFNCSEVTARASVKKLRLKGHSILPTKEGLMLVDIVNEDNADKVRRSGNWIIGEMVGMSYIGKVAKRPLIQVKKVLELTKEERHLLKRNLIMLTNLITAAGIEEELEQGGKKK